MRVALPVRQSPAKPFRPPLPLKPSFGFLIEKHPELAAGEALWGCSDEEGSPSVPSGCLLLLVFNPSSSSYASFFHPMYN